MREPFGKYIEANIKPGFLLIACGLPGTWKTETTEEVARIKGCQLLRTDLIRLEVLKNEDVFDARVAGDMNKRTAVYDEMFRQADEALKGVSCVILDATFVTQALRRRAAAIAAGHGVTFIVLQTDCPRAVSIRRILARTKEEYVSNALTEEAYLNNQKKFEAVDLDDLKAAHPGLDITHLVVDTSKDPPEDWYITGDTRA
ncbi:MAG TPA: ATP-binding protein [Dehalococcoidales bacterium]|nr:ATP-binding protein [Dehalococcoidales bacterium]